MNPYEVLGVRPTAVIEEIELAYKGRRAQYHPDRYGQLGAETQAWATRMMQQVNEAYRLLSDPGLRAKAHQTATSSNPPPDVRERKPNEGGTREQSLVASLLRPQWHWFHDNIHVWPNIPMKKAAGAMEAYARGVAHNEIVVLLDDTLFGGAREGVVLTETVLYAKQKFEGPRGLQINDVQSVNPGTGSRMMVNGDTFFEANFLDHSAIANFASRLGTALKDIRR